MKKSIKTGKLTKKFLFGLPEGLYLVMEAPGRPPFAETLAPIPHRRAQWRAIVTSRVNGRLCHVFNHPADFLAFNLEIPYPRDRN